MKKNIVIVIVVSIVFALSAFEWSQTPSEIKDFFAENRGDCFNTGIMYANEGSVSVTEKGTSIVNLQQQDTMGWFNSTLGNAVILVHDNEMMSVYSNLTEEMNSFESMNLESGDIIAKSGDSEWKDAYSKNCGSGFKIIDKERQTSVNPLLLMKTTTKRSYIPIKGLEAISRRGNIVDLYSGVNILAGQYTLYMQRPQNLMVRKSQVSLNGEVKETISYDSFNQNESKLVVQGNRNYSYAEIYPDAQKMRLAEVLLQRGSNTVEILLSGNDGSKTSVVYRLNVQ